MAYKGKELTGQSDEGGYEAPICGKCEKSTSDGYLKSKKQYLCIKCLLGMFENEIGIVEGTVLEPDRVGECDLDVSTDDYDTFEWVSVTLRGCGQITDAEFRIHINKLVELKKGDRKQVESNSNVCSELRLLEKIMDEIPNMNCKPDGEAKAQDEAVSSMAGSAYCRPKTRGELRDKLKEGVSCEVVASNAGITVAMLSWLNYWMTEDYRVRKSENDGWALFVPNV